MNTFYIIVLGLILSTIIGVFLILNSKINNLYKLLNQIVDIESTTNKNITEAFRLFKNLVDRFNKRILVDNEHYNNIITLLKSRFKDVDNATDTIYDRLNSMDNDTTILIIGKSNEICNEIKKQAKISSKINSKTKTKKNTDNKQKCE